MFFLYFIAIVEMCPIITGSFMWLHCTVESYYRRSLDQDLCVISGHVQEVTHDALRDSRNPGLVDICGTRCEDENYL